MKILIFGSSSFAAQGLRAALAEKGHEVWTFDRGPSFTESNRSMRGPYDKLESVAGKMGSCDAVVDYALVKFGGVEENLRLLRQVLDCARALHPKRLIYVSSVSVLPANGRVVDETTPTADHPYKGEYSRVKVLAENVVREEWKESSLQILRPGFIIGEGILDPMVGMGRLLPTGHVMGMGSRRTLIPLVTREAMHECVARMLEQPAQPGEPQTYMAAMPKPPGRKEYLEFMCREMGRGRGVVHFPAWLWRAGLFCVSLPLSILKRKFMRLDRTFEHNLNYREYDCRDSEQRLDMSFDLDWKQRLREIEGRVHQVAWPGQEPSPGKPDQGVAALLYVGLGRIVTQKHLPALRRVGFQGEIAWIDPAREEAPAGTKLKFLAKVAPTDGITHAVVAAPCHARAGLLEALPPSVTHILFEKPFANSTPQWNDFRSKLGQRSAFVLHNYRFKPNSLALRKYLAAHPPGRLRRASLHFETPSPANEMVAWMRREKENRILLTDYGLHFLDLALLFCEGTMRINRCDTTENLRGEIESIGADLSFDSATCSVLMRQGCHQRQCIITYDFQNYSVQLRFFPDIFVAVHGGHGLGDDARLAVQGLLGTGAKILEKLNWRIADRSHDHVLGAFAGCLGPAALDELSLSALTPFYDRLTALADRVYGAGESSRG